MDSDTPILFDLQPYSEARERRLNKLGIAEPFGAYMYEQAQPFFVKCKNRILSLPNTSSVAFRVVRNTQSSRGILWSIHEYKLHDTTLTLPSSFDVLVRGGRSLHDFFSKFTKRSGSSRRFEIDGPEPLLDIFFTLQIICAGGIVLGGDHNADDVAFRCLPPKDWVVVHYPAMDRICGSFRGQIERAAKQASVKFYSSLKSEPSQPRRRRRGRRNPSYRINYSFYSDRDSDNDFNDLNWAACDKDCAWCGRCAARLGLNLYF